MEKNVYKFLARSLLAVVVSVEASDLSFNENFESYAVGSIMDKQNQWIVLGGSADNTATVVSGGSVFDGGSGQCVLLDDNDSNGINARLGYVFASPVKDISFQFDYKPGTDVSQMPLVQVMGLRASDRKIIAGVYLALDYRGLVQNFVLGDGFTSLNVSLDADTWYRVILTVHDVSGSADTYDVRIVDAGLQTIAAVSDLPFSNDLQSLKSLYFSFNKDGSSSEYTIDNVMTIPE